MDLGRLGSHGLAVVPRALVVNGSEAEHVATLHRSVQECHVPDQMRKQNPAILKNHVNISIQFSFYYIHVITQRNVNLLSELQDGERGNCCPRAKAEDNS